MLAWRCFKFRKKPNLDIFSTWSTLKKNEYRIIRRQKGSRRSLDEGNEMKRSEGLMKVEEQQMIHCEQQVMKLHHCRLDFKKITHFDRLCPLKHPSVDGTQL